MEILSFLFQIAYRIASNKFPGKLSETFLVLSDDAQPADDEGGEFQTQGRGRGQKYPRDEDQMSVESHGSKRQDVVSSAEKNKKSQSQNRGGGSKSKSRGRN